MELCHSLISRAEPLHRDLSIYDSEGRIVAEVAVLLTANPNTRQTYRE